MMAASAVSAMTKARIETTNRKSFRLMEPAAEVQHFSTFEPSQPWDVMSHIVAAAMISRHLQTNPKRQRRVCLRARAQGVRPGLRLPAPNSFDLAQWSTLTAARAADHVMGNLAVSCFDRLAHPCRHNFADCLVRRGTAAARADL
jgi:hypothetical protein